MSKFSRRLQSLADKATQFKQVIESVPPKVSDIRDALLTTTGQLQQMRADVQSAVAGLQADTEEKLLQTLREIDAGGETFREAGFELTGVDMELGLNRRLIAHLGWVEDVPESTLRSVLSACQSQRTLHAMLSAVIQAGKLADQVKLTNLGCEELVVHVGPAPTVRICWRTAEEEEPVTTPVSMASTPLAAAPAAATSAFTSSSYFEPRRAPEPTAKPTSTATPEHVAAPTAVTAPAPAVSPAPATGGDWRRGALDRFKRMPDLSGTKH